MVKHKIDFPILFVLLGVAIVALVPFIKTGFATGDDVEFMITAYNGTSWYVAQIYANDTGRFYYFLTKPFYDLPYLIGNLTTLKSINILFVIINFAILGNIANIISNNKWIGYFVFLITLVFVSIKGSNNPIISFLLYFTVSFSFILLSILYALKYAKYGVNRFRLFSASFFTLGLLFYEVYIMYLPLLVLIVSYLNFSRNDIQYKLKIRKSFISAVPFLIIALLYVFVYFAFRHFISPAVYDGSKFAHSFEIKNSLKVIFKLASGAYPSFFYFNGQHVYQESSYLIENHHHGIWGLLLTSKPEWYFKAIIVAVLSYYFVRKINLREKKKTLIILAIIFLYIYLPHIPLSLTEKYSVQYSNMSNYVTTYFSYAAVSLFLAYLLSMQSFINNLFLKKLITGGIILFIALGSLLTDYSNYHSVKDLQNPLNTFNCIDSFIQTETFSSIPEGAFIYAPNLYSKSSTISWANTHNWSDYIHIRTSKKLNISKSKQDFIAEFDKKEKPLYYLNFGYDKKSIDRYIAIGPVADNSLIDSLSFNILSDSASVFYYSTYKDFSITFGTTKETEMLDTVIINDSLFSSTNIYHKFRFKYKNYNEYFKSIHISAKNIDVRSINITNKFTGNKIDIEL